MSCRLLYLVGQLRSGGLERQLCYLLENMNRERYKPAVVVWNYCKTDQHLNQIRSLGVPVYSLPDTASRVLKLRALRGLVRQLQPNVVHSYSFYTNIAAHYSALGTRALAFGSVRSTYTRDKVCAGPWFGKLNSRWPRSQICNSYTAANNARCSRSLFGPARLTVVRSGVDLQRFSPSVPPHRAEAHILGVGSLLPVKRWDRLLTGAATLKKRGLKYLLHIAGDGPLRRFLEQQVQELGIVDHVKFLGHRDDIPALLADATFLAHSSDDEGCPNVVMEAMASGRAVVATDAGDVPDLVEDGRTGFVVRRGDDVTFADRMATLITDHRLCARMGEAGRVKAERELGLDRLVSETLAAYQAAGWRAA